MEEGKKCKIVVFGAFGSGKTTLIRTLDPASKHIEASCAGGTTTIALDFGHVVLDGCEVHLYGTPGQERFGFAREIIGKGMDGAILLVDATAPSDGFTRHLFDSLTAAKVPFVVFLNKCGRPGADPASVRGMFGSVPVKEVSAVERRAIAAALGEFASTLEPHPSGHPHLGV